MENHHASESQSFPSKLPTMARETTPSLKRPASLLPAFEPLSSSPVLPRPSKRQNTGRQHLPTPVPTSSTGIASSSPGPFVRRSPLGTVSTVELSDHGDVLMMGRSSNSSHFQLSANRLVSRVHVKARYIPAHTAEPAKLEIVCTGWNGMKLHCQGREWELRKGDSFTSETEGSDIMLDVQDARVLIRWPKREGVWDDSPLQSSPLRRAPRRVISPESPTAHLSRDEGIQIYEDEVELPVNEGVSFESEDGDPDEENDPIVHSFGPFGANISGRFAAISTGSPERLHGSPRKKSRPMQRTPLARALFSSSPPSGAKLAMPSSPIRQFSPIRHSSPVKEETPCPPSKDETPCPAPKEAPVAIDPEITNHVINQLAFSRLSSTPLSTIMQNLPTESKDLSKDVLRAAIEASPAVGIIARQGKDAAGKVLESEYYYLPEHDGDEQRRAVVDGMRKPSLRNCRKQHKVCFLYIFSVR